MNDMKLSKFEDNLKFERLNKIILQLFWPLEQTENIHKWQVAKLQLMINRNWKKNEIAKTEMKTETKTEIHETETETKTEILQKTKIETEMTIYFR